MSSSWRDDLTLALRANGTSLPDVLDAADSDGIGAWLRDCLDREETPSAAAYLSLGDLTGIEVEVLAGDIEPKATWKVALRSAEQTLPAGVGERPVALHRALRAVLRHAEYRGSLERLADFQSNLVRVTAPSATRVAREVGRRVALSMRQQLGLGTEPIHDLAQVVEEFGVPVEFSTKLPDTLQGFTTWDLTSHGWSAVITINAKDVWTRQRYTLAHEFCHVLHGDRPLDLTSEYDGETVEKAKRDPLEARADSFAATFLVPRLGLQQAWVSEALDRVSKSVALARMMWHWGVSKEAMCIAMENSNVSWTKRDSDSVVGSVGSLMEQAGLDQEWTAAKESLEGEFVPSAWLATCAVELFEQGKAPLELYAAAADVELREAARLVESA